MSFKYLQKYLPIQLRLKNSRLNTDSKNVEFDGIF